MFSKITQFFAAPKRIKLYQENADRQAQRIYGLSKQVRDLEAKSEVYESESRLWSAAYDAEARKTQQMRKLVSDAIVTFNTLPSMQRTAKTDRSELIRVIKKIAEVRDENADT